MSSTRRETEILNNIKLQRTNDQNVFEFKKFEFMICLAFRASNLEFLQEFEKFL